MKDLFSIVTHPAPSLRERSVEVDPTDITTPEFQAYLDKLTHTMIVKDGVGIASPQVGINKRVIVVMMNGKTECYINPEILKVSEAMIEDEEGCLSVPGIYGMVDRHKRIRVRATTRHGRTQEFDLHAFPAIVFQHEIDHLNGVLFIDKMKKETHNLNHAPSSL
jgi:peptide deformylase